MTLYLKEYQKYKKPKLKVLLLLSKFRRINFDLSYLWYPFRYRTVQFLTVPHLKSGTYNLRELMPKAHCKPHYSNSHLEKVACKLVVPY